MAYLRYGRKCNWYVFWQETKAKQKENVTLAVWHIEHRAETPTFTYTQVLKMLEDNSFDDIPGFKKEDESMLRPALEAFVAEVDNEFG